MSKSISLLLSLFFLTACNEKTYSVEDFLNDNSLRNTFLSKCNNGELHNQDLNCLNVRKAEQNRIMLESMTEHGTKF